MNGTEALEAALADRTPGLDVHVYMPPRCGASRALRELSQTLAFEGKTVLFVVRSVTQSMELVKLYDLEHIDCASMDRMPTTGAYDVILVDLESDHDQRSMDHVQGLSSKLRLMLKPDGRIVAINSKIEIANRTSFFILPALFADGQSAWPLRIDTEEMHRFRRIMGNPRWELNYQFCQPFKPLKVSRGNPS
jgi:hypothetical protein